MLGGNISGMHDVSVVLTFGSDSAGHYVRDYPSGSKKSMLIGIIKRRRNKQPDMEAKSFARIVERQVRKALKAEREEGKYQQKTARSVRSVRVSASHHTELACFKLLG